MYNYKVVENIKLVDFELGNKKIENLEKDGWELHSIIPNSYEEGYNGGTITTYNCIFRKQKQK